MQSPILPRRKPPNALAVIALVNQFKTCRNNNNNNNDNVHLYTNTIVLSVHPTGRVCVITRVDEYSTQYSLTIDKRYYIVTLNGKGAICVREIYRKKIYRNILSFGKNIRSFLFFFIYHYLNVSTYFMFLKFS